MTSIKDAVGEDFYEQLRGFLSWAFPGADPPDDGTVDGAVRALHRQHGAAAVDAGLPALPPELLEAPRAEAEEKAALADAPSYPLYIARATHHRVRSMTTPVLGDQSDVPFQSEFVGHLPCVRVPLPQSFRDGQNPSVRTPIGNVYFSSDHLVGSVELVSEKFGPQLGYSPARVDLVTPARTPLLRRRFGAIASYLGYRNAGDAGPSFYILEAGMATGEARMLYLGATMDTIIVQRSGYVPTAYSSATNFYRGNLTVRDDEPVAMMVQPTPPNETRYAQISVVYQRVTSTGNDPLELLVQAAMRIALIGQNMKVPSGIPLQEVMAKLAQRLEWVHQPAYGGPGTAGDAEQA